MLSLLATLWSNTYFRKVTIIVSVVGMCYFYYWRTESKIATLIQQNQVLALQNQTLTETLSNLKRDYDNIIKAKDELHATVVELKKETDNIKDTLYRENKKKKSLEELALKKTKLIQNLVNKATHNVMVCFDTISTGGDC